MSGLAQLVLNGSVTLVLGGIGDVESDTEHGGILKVEAVP